MCVQHPNHIRSICFCY